MNDYKNIIFDLGGVLLNIDYHRTIEAFQKYTSLNVDELYSQHGQHKAFNLYETGSISTSEFRDHMRDTLKLEASDIQIDQAWCALLLDFPTHRYNFLKEISKHKRIFLFSNTCEIHKTEFDKTIKNQLKEDNFDGIFEKAYYSHILGIRKPDAEGFLKILNDNDLEMSETIFIDDSIGHIEGARKVGLNAFHLTPDMDIKDIGLL